MKKHSFILILLAAVFVCVADGGFAQLANETNSGLPMQFESIPDEAPDITNWMSNPITPIARKVNSNVKYTNWFVIPYLILPQILLLWAILRYRSRPGRKPATFHENVPLEFAWTLLPAMSLVALAIPSYDLIKYIEQMPEADVNVVINGHQFFWSYEYLDDGFIISDKPLVVPVGKTVVANVTSKDVNHAWWVPAFGVKMDAVAGRNTQIWFNVEETGWYKGQCAELCGELHSQMYIDVFVVTEEEYEDYVQVMRAQFLGEDEEAPADSPDVDVPREGGTDKPVPGDDFGI